MKILALEFSAAQRSVAVACGPAHVREVIDTSPGKAMKPFTMIESALDEAGVGGGEIECIVIGLGPGSYTGIRAGIALAQGWQLATNVKLLGVSSVQAIAKQAQMNGMRGKVHVVVDAQRGEFYHAEWDLADADITETQALQIVDRGTIEDASQHGTLIGPDAAKVFASGRIVYPRATLLTSLAQGRTDFVDGDKLEPIYLRETSFVKAPPPRIV